MKLPKLPKMPVPVVEYQIGEFYIGRFGKDFWIEHESGEGMQVSKDRMEKLIADFYKENF